MGKRFSIFAPIVLLAGLFIKVFMDTNRFKVNKIQLETDKIPVGSKLTVLQITDVHNKIFGRDHKRLIRAVKNSDADIIVLTGDLISKDTTDLADAFSLVEQITAIHPDVFFISGNHEWANVRSEEFFEGLKERNVTILNNRNVRLDHNNITYNLVGIDDASTKHEDMYYAFHNINRERYTILLSHTPGIVEKYAYIPADLILSGHTHGGQVRLPFIGALIAPDQSIFPKLDKGIFDVGKNQHLYIDSGLGTSRAPIRFMNKSQVSLISISNKAN